MPKPETPVADDASQDEPQEVNGIPPTLDEVHIANQAKVEKEDEDAEDIPADNADDIAEDDKNESTPDDVDTPDDQAEEPEPGESDKPETTPATDGPAETPAVTPDASVDTDITKNGDGKVAIKDAEGNTMYFNNLEEVPDDFEPASYKALMVGTKALFQKEQTDAQTAQDAEATAAQQAHKEATDKMQESWEADATALVRSGALPNEPAKLEAAKNEVYDYIESEMKKGNVITSFNQAYKALMYDKRETADADKQKELDKAKKDRGGVVQGGSGGTSKTTTPRGNRVIEAPPSGVGLDAVHNRAINSL